MASNLDIARKQSKIKRINDRLRQMRLQFGGKSSGFYQSFRNAIALAIPPEALTSEGTISTSKKTLDKIPDDVLDDLLLHHTVGQIKKEAAEAAKRESELTGQKITTEQYLKAQDYVEKIIQNDGDTAYEALTIYWAKVGGRGSGAPRIPYTEWANIINDLYAMDEARRSGNMTEANNIENKMYKRIEDRNEKQRQRAMEEIFS